MTLLAKAQIIAREDIEKPLLEGEPFDLIRMDGANDNALIRIVPQENISQPLPTDGNLVFEFFADSESLLEVPYKTIAKYESFNDLVLAEANEFLDVRKYGLAFRNLLYVYDRGGKNDPNLVETLRTCLFLDAGNRFKNEEFELALSIFEDLYQDKPNFKVPGIDKELVDIITDCYDGILKQKFEAGDYKAINETVKGLKLRYGNATQRLTRNWDKRFSDKAAELLNDDWAARRIGRLTQRNLVEITGLSDEGARYEFLNGSINRIDDVGLVYAIDLDPNMEKIGVPQITAIDMANRLLANANPNSQTFDPTWRRILRTVELVSSTRVLITLQRPFVRLFTD